MRRNDSNGTWSAMPWAFLVDVRRGVGGEAVGAVGAVGAAAVS